MALRPPVEARAERNRAVFANEDRLRHVILHMRPRDAAEIYALRWNDDPEELVQELLPRLGAMCRIWTRDGVPVSVQGVLPIRPGVWEMFAFGTHLWPYVVLDMTRHAERFIKPALRRANPPVRRVECRALISHTDSRKWIESLGAHPEGVHPFLGRNGETFVSYVWFPN